MTVSQAVIFVVWGLTLGLIGYMLGHARGSLKGRALRERLAALDEEVKQRVPPPKKEQLPLPKERVRPPRGACGVTGCPIQVEHSHVMDFARRLKEEREKGPR